jgi:hypothetical protein
MIHRFRFTAEATLLTHNPTFFDKIVPSQYIFPKSKPQEHLNSWLEGLSPPRILRNYKESD